MNRIERYQEFRKILSTAKYDINNIKNKFDTWYFDDKYTFNICPGGRYGGNSNIILEYFYGNRPYEGIRDMGAKGFVRKLLVEHGVTVLYQRDDRGYISCLLYPAGSENLSQIEDFIFLDIQISPEKLTKKMLKKHFKYFMSYMHTTSLDGNPSWIDKLRVFWIKFNNPIAIDKKIHRPLRNKIFLDILKYALTVGLSGFILLLLQLFLNDISPSIEIYYL